jgi:RNA polymerase sigma factor (sigma-70 family)
MVARKACGGGRMAAQPQPKTASHRRGQMLTGLLEKDGAALRRQARAHAQRPADAEDALQDACVAFLRYYDGLASEAVLWMQVVVKRCAWAIARRASRACETGFDLPSPNGGGEVPELDPLDERPGPAQAVERDEAIAERSALLGRLKRDERRALLLLALGYSYREIAQRQGWTYTKVNRCIAEGRAALRGRLVERRG